MARVVMKTVVRFEIQHPVPGRAVGLEQAPAGEAADQGDQRVEAALTGAGRVHEPSQRRRVGHVDTLQDEASRLFGLDGGLELLAFGVDDVGDVDRVAGGQQPAGDGLTQGPGTARDQRDAAHGCHEDSAGMIMMAERWTSS